MLELEGLKMIGYDDSWRAATRNPTPYGPYLSQAIEKELRPRFAQAVMEILGPLGQLQGTKWAPLAGAVEQSFRESFGNHAGGTSQLKRMVLATRGLGLPR
jgi:hypothetical protein